MIGSILPFLMIVSSIQCSRVVLQHKTETYQAFTQQRMKRDVMENVQIVEFLVHTSIAVRYTETVVSSVVENTGGAGQQTTFEVLVPESAFITDFVLWIGGQSYESTVYGKDEAQQMFDAAHNDSLVAGLISTDGVVEPSSYENGMSLRNMEVFTVTITLPANSRAKFELTHADLLQRRNGAYQYQLDVRPGQCVEDFNITVFAFEPEGIEHFGLVQSPATVNQQSLETTIPDLDLTDNLLLPGVPRDQWARVMISPTKQQQCDLYGEHGVKGRFVFSYDVVRNGNIPSVFIDEGYFIQHMAPQDLPTIGKNIIFVIDKSGSMQGEKIQQARDALEAMLDQLHEMDRFQLILFSVDILNWPEAESVDDSDLIDATPSNIQEAKNFVHSSLVADGGTNMNTPLIEAIYRLKIESRNGVNLVVFLTDGQATEGVINAADIESNIRLNVDPSTRIYSLAFGYDPDYELLMRLSTLTGGSARRVWPEADATEQLLNFFSEISEPKLYNMQYDYPEDIVDTSSLVYGNGIESLGTFADEGMTFFEGSEILTVGKLHNTGVTHDSWSIHITGQGEYDDALDQTMPFDVTAQVNPWNGNSGVLDTFIPAGFTEQAWVYMFIKELIALSKIETNATEKARLERDAYSLALQYQLVTPLTSMIVVAPDEVGVELSLQKEGIDDHEDSNINIMYSSSTGSSAMHYKSHMLYTVCLLLLILLLRRHCC